MEVDPVEANQRMKPFYPSSVLSMDDDAVIILAKQQKPRRFAYHLGNWSPFVF
jgi:hypothetical protein